MADFNRNSNGVFGEIKLNGNSNDTESTSFFEGTMVSGINIPTADSQNNGTQNGVNETKRGIFGNFETVQNNENYNNGNGANNGVNFQPVEQNKALAKTGGIWSKIKSFLFKEIDLNAPVKITGAFKILFKFILKNIIKTYLNLFIFMVKLTIVK